MLFKRKTTAWELDSPDELAALERLDPNLRGLADNAVFRYLRYKARNRSAPIRFSTNPIIVFARMVLRAVLFFMAVLLALIGGYWPADETIKGRRSFLDPEDVDLKDLRLRSETMEFGALSAEDLATGVWAFLTAQLRIQNKWSAWLLMMAAGVCVFLKMGALGAFLAGALAGAGALWIGVAPYAHLMALASAEHLIRVYMIAEREELSGFGTPDPLWKHADEATNRWTTRHKLVNYSFLVLVASGAVAWGLFEIMDRTGLRPQASQNPLVAILLNLLAAWICAALGWLCGWQAYNMSPAKYEKFLGRLRTDADVLIQLWHFRVQTFGSESKENAAGYGKERVKRPEKTARK